MAPRRRTSAVRPGAGDSRRRFTLIRASARAGYNRAVKAQRIVFSLLGLVAFCVATASARAAEPVVAALLERVLGAQAAAQISPTLVAPADGSQQTASEEFTISGTTGHVEVTGTSLSALTRGVGWYLKYVAHADLVLRGRNPVLPSQLPAPSTAIRKTASVPYRYAFNDTHDGYSGPYLSWDDWENQLDLLALQHRSSS